MIIQGQVGAITKYADGSQPGAGVRQGNQGDMVVSELHGRLYEQAYRGNLYYGGTTALTTINNATFTIATTGVTATPIVGLYNPLSNSATNLVVLQATLACTLTALAATGGGPYVWMVSTGNNAISTGNTPYNRKTLTSAGSFAKVFGGAALTGMTGTLAAMAGSALGGGSYSNASFTATAAGPQTLLQGFVENFDGSLIVPPGGVLALMATTTPAAHSVTSSLLWEEVPV